MDLIDHNVLSLITQLLAEKDILNLSLVSKQINDKLNYIYTQKITDHAVQSYFKYRRPRRFFCPGECNNCHKTNCKIFYLSCHICHLNGCQKCFPFPDCNICKQIVCVKCAHRCISCMINIICNQCPNRCRGCLLKNKQQNACDICKNKNTFCRKSCDTCFANICPSCINQCYSCDKEQCLLCISRCNSCRKFYCSNCYTGTCCKSCAQNYNLVLQPLIF